MIYSKILEFGYVAIPIKKEGKNPAILDWSKYCLEKPTIKEVEKWDEVYKNYNVGITCGKASNIIVIDIDTDDQTILDLCQKSPIVRRGKKGEARFFKYTDKIKTQAFPGLDILSNGRQIIIPPSIHPETKKPYVWLSPDTIETITPDELPEIDESILNKLINAIVKNSSKHHTTILSGRNNKFVSMVTAMRGRGEGEAHIVNEIYNWDRTYHNPRLFLDKSEGFPGASEQDAQKNAWLFVNRVTQSLIKNGSINLDAQSPVIELSEEQEQQIAKQFEQKEFIEPTGLIKDIKDLIVDYSERVMPNIALGGAVSLVSILAANRYRFANTWPNVYVLNLAPTGGGKSAPQYILSLILNERLGSTLLGFGNYQSSSAFTKNLISRRERLDVIDEISSLFSQLKGGGLWQAGILEEMCKVWSSSNSKYIASEYAEREDSSSCFNPCISVLGSSTIEGLKSNVTKMMIVKGLIPRFLIFSHDNYGQLKDDFLNEKLLRVIVEQCKQILSRPKPVREGDADVVAGPIYNPVDIAPTSKDAIEYFQHLRREFAENVETEQSQALKNVYTRAKENIMKLALIHAVGNFRTIELRDLSWAKSVFETSVHNCTPFLEESAVDNDWERDLNRVFNFIAKTGYTPFGRITNNIRSIPRDKVEKIIDTLLISDRIVKVESPRYKNVKAYSVNTDL